ncbi:MAG: lysophospholipid acyltransferase family protein [Myxococcaceae bacterium]
MTNKLYSVAFWFALASTSLVMFVGAVFLWFVTMPFDPDRRILHLYTCFWGHMYFHFNPTWTTRVEGRQKLPWRGGAVLVSNHESLGDILILFGLYRPFKWVSKQASFRLPLIGWNMTLNNYVSLVRGNKESIAKMMAECERWLDRGMPVMIFPEGTRSPDGNIQAFKDGAFRLAIAKKVPIYPIVVTGSADTLPKHGWVVQSRSFCRVRVLDPVPWNVCGENVEALRDHVRQIIVDEKARMLAENPGASPRLAA